MNLEKKLFGLVNVNLFNQKPLDKYNLSTKRRWVWRWFLAATTKAYPTYYGVWLSGKPKQPLCGYSKRVCQILQMHGVDFDAHDVLESLELREGIKKFTNWPTIPQVFISGEFVGGSDILLEKHKTGELIKDFKKIGIKSALLEKKEE